MITLPRSESPLASILIVTERNPDHLAACLRSLERHLPARESAPTETIIALNASTRETRALVADRTRGAVVVDSDVRIGFAGGLNLARSVARGQFLVILQDDTEIQPAWLEPLLAATREEPAAGAVGSLVLNPDGSLQTAGRILWRNGGSSPVWATSQSPPPLSALGQRRAVDYTSSSSLLVRAASFDSIGGAEESLFPAINVDADLCLGLRRLGQYVLCEPRSVVHHRHHGTTGGPTAFRHFLAERNRAFLRAKFSAELQAFDVPAPESPEAVQRALERSTEWANTCRRRGAAPQAPAAPRGIDRAAQARRALALEAALQRDWAAELERALEADRDRLAGREGEIERLRARLTLREAEIGAINGTRWWRLYLRILPALRRIRRPAGSSRRE